MLLGQKAERFITKHSDDPNLEFHSFSTALKSCIGTKNLVGNRYNGRADIMNIVPTTLLKFSHIGHFFGP